MDSFEYLRAHELKEALKAGAKTQPQKAQPDVRFLAGGTTLIDLMKLQVEVPHTVIDLNAISSLKEIKKTSEGEWQIGALVRNAELAHHKELSVSHAVLSQALLSGASAQLRNKATTAGNVLQRTRCVYFRDESKACNKRKPGSGCDAIQGFNRNLAILGTSEKCIATNPSDMNVAMMALEANIHLQGPTGTREVAYDDFYLVPGNTPEKETVLGPGEIITHVTIPSLPNGTRSLYTKLRDRASYEFALASTAAVVTIKSGRIDRIRLAMGGVATKPWRLHETEALLHGEAPNEKIFRQAAEVAMKDAKPQSDNGFKIELAKRCLIYTLKKVTEAEG